MLSVGEVARLAGLTTKALRHYDLVGVLTPERVDQDGYRWYAETQVATARTIGRLRALDVSLDVVRAVVRGSPEPDVRRLLDQHRTALQARHDRLRRALHSLDHALADPRGVTMTLNDATTEPVADERQLAIALFGETWRELEKETRTPDEADRMIHLAHASRLHWDNVGDDQNRAAGEWQISRVYSTLGRGEPALFHAQRCVDYSARDGIHDWMVAGAQEGLARALAVSGDLEAARDARDRAIALLGEISDPEDQAIIAADIETLPIP
ncbi:MAG TPA: hypothetical protein DEQ43_09370 [Nocardioides bacterium]|nr:hypothetical protein [Nocardioides sp.]